ncbi:plastocyanin/azurin family copper-binding protein [Thalassoroseus pseudoceratinae]|uniref:plastocyanin/azurin family copper-binding protein n=1 Tax=Thalassoroseus pseudoceratinae TaxID=2713176 RepID=UPI00141ED889|nr:plastocyanin/azurin family copper-binding protein [Thalassoroseus pseudoceratinae]
MFVAPSVKVSSYSWLVGLVAFAIPQLLSADEIAEDSQYAAVVRMTDDLKFSPAVVTIQSGEIVLWKNEPSTVAHTVTADPKLAETSENVQLPKGARPFNSGKMEAGDSFAHQFSIPGTYQYICIPHERAGMVGEIFVKPSAEFRSETKVADGSSIPFAEDEAEQKMILGTHRPPRPDDYREATGFRKFLYWLGNFHPAATDLPVGAILVAFTSEVLLLVTGKPMFGDITRFCVWLAGLASVGVAFGGWCLAGFRFDDLNRILDSHRWWGTGTALWLIVTIVFSEIAARKKSNRARWLFRSALLGAVIIVAVTSFFGGAMIYGIDHYAWPT